MRETTLLLSFYFFQKSSKTAAILFQISYHGYASSKINDIEPHKLLTTKGIFRARVNIMNMKKNKLSQPPGVCKINKNLINFIGKHGLEFCIYLFENNQICLFRDVLLAALK